MVYESRRIYSTSRPIVSTSYSYSQPFEELPAAVLRRPDLFMTYAPVSRKGRKQHRVIVPTSRMIHHRLSPVSAPPRRHRVLNNIYDSLDIGRAGNSYVLVNYRPTPPPIPVPRSRITYIEDLTNRSGYDEIERETRSVQRDMDNMLYRVSAGLPFSPSSLYSINHIPMRSASEVKDVADMRRLYVRDRNPNVGWEAFNKATLYRMPVIHRPDPAALESKYYYIGRQNLACLSFYGGRPIPKRRRFYPGYEDDRASSVRDDVTFRSFYSKLRDAANVASNAAKRVVYQPLHYSKKTLFGDNGIKREVRESKWVQRAMANEKEPPKKLESAIARSSIKEVRRESLTKEPKIEPTGRPINITLPGPRKSITEIIKEDVPKVENLPEQTVLLRRPSKLEPVPGTPPVDVKAEETFKIPSKRKEPTPPPKEPTPPPREPTPPPPKEPTPPPKEPTPPPKEPTPPPKEPTPPPKEPTPPPKEPTPPPKEQTPPPPEPETVVAAEVNEDAAPAADEEAEEKSVSVAAEGSEVESNKGEGDVADIPLDDEVDEVCEAENEVEEAPPAENGPKAEELEEQAAEVEEMEIASEQPTAELDAEVEAVDEPVPEPEPAHEEIEKEEEEVEADEGCEVEETEVVDGEEEPETGGVSILVADIDGPIQTEQDDQLVIQEPMTVEQIQAAAEQRRAEFARLLEEHHDIVEKVELLEHHTDIIVPKLESVNENNVDQLE